MPRYKAKFLIELESEEVISEKWVNNRFRDWHRSKEGGFVKIIPIEPLWTLIPEEED